MNITKRLFELKDEKYKVFSEKLIPDTKLPIIGVRVPDLRKLAKSQTFNKTAKEFLSEKHSYYEEVFLHGLIITYNKTDYKSTIKLLDDFIPQIDNWSVCDCIASSVKISKKDSENYFNYLISLLNDEKPYSVRFAIVSLKTHFIPAKDAEILQAINNVKSDNYYINMALSWLYCEMLIKDYSSAIQIIEEKQLSPFVQNTSIKKACESYRISNDKKEYLKQFKLKNQE